MAKEKKFLSNSEKITLIKKAHADCLLKIKKIAKERDEKIAELIKKIERKQIEEIRKKIRGDE
jgi:hypothetical protein